MAERDQIHSLPHRVRADERRSLRHSGWETVREISGGLFGEHSPTGSTYSLSEVKLLYPCQPTKILCVGLNYKSHLAGRPQPTQPRNLLQAAERAAGSRRPHCHSPATPPICITKANWWPLSAKQARNVSAEEARDAIFGVTCGNDVSERNWQHGAGKDLQWWRAKGSDTFAPFGPVIAAGADYGNLQLTTRLNGEVVQQQ